MSGNGWDDLSLKKKDKNTVSGTEPWEVQAMADKCQCPEEDVQTAIQKVGNNLQAVEKWLKKNK